MTKKGGKSFDFSDSLSGFTKSLERHAERKSDPLRIFDIPLNKLTTAPWNARRRFDEGAVARLGRDLEANGQIHPILVRPKGDFYEIVVGERRFRAAQAVGWAKLKAQEAVVGDREAQRISLAENLGREDLNPFEETLGYMQLLLLELRAADVSEFANSTSEDEMSRLAQVLRDFYRDVTRARNNVIPEDEEPIYAKTGSLGPTLKQILENIFDGSGSMTWLSFVKNRLPLLELPQDVRNALQEGRLEYTKARVVARVDNEGLRRKLLAEAINKSLSLADLRKRVNAQRTPAVFGNLDVRKKLCARTRRVSEAMRTSGTLEHKTKLKKAERLLADLERLLEISERAT